MVNKPLFVALVSPDPWFSPWNHCVLEALFHHIRRSGTTDAFFEFLILNPFVSTWMFAAAFYIFWTKDDEQKAWRRRCLFRVVVAFGIAFLISLIFRPWISWPAPARNTTFQQLFPQYFWGQGTANCFPSHATLAYFMVAAGFWPLNRRLSACFSVLAILLISLPRVYLGGHYPIDILASLILGIVVLTAMWQWAVPATVSHWLVKVGPGAIIRELFLFLWTVELADGFRGTTSLIGAARRVSHWL
jgi:undecaprenyl-diphosphatase